MVGERNCGQELWRGLWAALGLAGWTVTPGASGQDGAPGERKGGPGSCSSYAPTFRYSIPNCHEVVFVKVGRANILYLTLC